MKVALTLPQIENNLPHVINQDLSTSIKNEAQQPAMLEKMLTWWIIKLRIFYFACIILKRPFLIWKTFRAMLTLRNNVWGGDLKKLYNF